MNLDYICKTCARLYVRLIRPTQLKLVKAALQEIHFNLLNIKSKYTDFQDRNDLLFTG